MSILESNFGRGAAFFGLAAAYSAAPFYLWRLNPKNPLSLVAYMYSPAAAAITMDKLIYGKIRWEELGVRWEAPTPSLRFFASALTPLLISPLIILLSKVLFPDRIKLSTNVGDNLLESLTQRMDLNEEQLEQAKQSLLFRNLLPTAILGGLIGGATINTVAAFGEELGWRGWLLRHLQDSGLSFWQRVTVTGLMWGVWHWPLIYYGYNYPTHPKTGMAIFPVFCTAISALSSFVTEISPSKLSVFNASLLHGQTNAFGGFPVLFGSGGDDLTYGSCSVSGVLIWGLVAGAVALARNYASPE